MKYSLPNTDRPTSSGLVLTGVLLLLAGLVACDRSPAPTGDSIESMRPVRTAIVEIGSEPERLRLPGVTRAVERADLAFLHGGHLAERFVARGERVQTGQALAVLHNPALMPGVAAAEARVREIDQQFDQLERDTRRLQNLHERGLVATDELDRVRSNRDALRQSREQAQAQLEEARDQLAEATLRAPFAGYVVELHAEPGQFVSAGQPIASISAPDRLEVEIRLPARRARQFGEGDTATVLLLDEGKAATATITETGLAAPGQPATLIVALPEIEASNWQPGQAVQVELNWIGPDTVQVPLAAIIGTGPGSNRVFRVRDGIAEAIVVEPGPLHGGWVRVTGALEAGDEVVVAGHSQLLDGERVRVLP